ncbi:trypsin-like peptidase domain-containing protein [Alphaproteobacteria bacterium]|nr:trypsin-like peptidase domain-containing protein [Alphaproteobacteria bacterium]
MLLIPSLSWGETLEKVIADANFYTVKIDISTDIPFIEDGYYGSGTGFLVDKESGLILTNKHVSSQSPSLIDVNFKGEDYLEGTIAYIDPIFDLALIKIDPAFIPDAAVNAPLGCKQVSVQGESVVAFGHPAGQDFTASTGIISGQRFELSAQAEFIQTDAAINPGNSGGPLISVKTNKIIGINTYGIEAEGLNFAIPAEHFCKIVDLYKEGKDPSPAKLPFIFASNTDLDLHLKVSDYIAFGVNNCQGGESTNNQIRPLEIGDEILQINDVEVKNPSDIYSVLRGPALDQSISMLVQRDNQELEVIVDQPFERRANTLDRVGVTFSGLMIGTDLSGTDRLENEAFYNYCQHLTIQIVDTGPAYGELYRYDQIVSVDGEKFFELEKLHDFLQGKEKVEFIVRRIEYFDSTQYVVDVTKVIEIEDVEYLTF